MHLVIRAHTLKGETLSQAITGHFDERGGTIGRSDTNTLSLPDPERHISRLQAEVWFNNGGFSIRNVGSANAITVNGRPINPGEGTNLSDGDEIIVGSYGMRATFGEAVDPAATQPVAVDPRTVIKSSATEGKTNPRPRSSLGGSTVASTTSASNPFADLLGSAVKPAADDPFAGLMGGQAAHPPTTAVHVRVPPARPAAPVPPAPAPAPVAARLPDDFDPFADLAPPPSSSAAQTGLAGFMAGSPPAPSPSAALPADLGLGDLIGTPPAQASSLDAMFGLGGAPAPGSDPLAGFLSTPASGAKGAPADNKDPMAMFGGTASAPPPPVAPTASNHTPELRAAYVPPAVQAPRPAPRPAPAPVPAPTPIAAPTAFRSPPPPAPRSEPETVPGVKPSRLVFDSAHAPLDEIPPVTAPAPLAAATPSAPPDALWAAFCEGAGVNIKLPQGLTPEMMKIIGQVMHHAIDGTIKLVHIRAAAKQEMKADVTTIQARNNNPLKFSPDAGVAIEQLLQPPMRGFMMGPVAVNDVMDDLLGHAIGTMAGMRAALTGVLDKFEPGKLENKLAGNSVLDSVLPMNRRAKLWELYLQHYKRIRDDAQEDFHDLFGKAFIEAYEEQLDRLDQARHPSV
ncbi:type VI secretion system-associated FHA domain protein TagH [Piscinibacter sp. HJYY11]|uniref:type VI secretion system-associated FHA domain protein TagH n=1 Tax=Piscinibacter sp. HJYY11 TaxID=2801333 RepID=UPI00191FCBC7|nr:type VI secretion system-associated FHA domain protein TagH [Piscinibacter sp. HJYY11]MBL0726367.1 type VI secretion system-associated FHA domain protein TagH [Piscinibacter sp. HJYY11]